LEITGANTYTGATVVRQGSLVVNGSIANATTTTVQSGATISGSGSVGNLTVDSGAFVNPGNSPGILTVNGAYNQAGTLVTEITGLNAGTQHDQVVVNGAVSLTGSLNVQFTGGTYSVDNLIFLLLNDSTDAVNGIFTGFNEGDTVTQYGGFDWIISYSADSSTSSFTGGNDIALRAIPEPSAAILGGLGLLGCLRRRRK
jgi:autotransporter-associated beta strand protein